MPWIVQIDQGMFIHEFGDLHRWPESHGCIRMPMRAASWLYHWIDIGRPISISGKWKRVVKMPGAERSVRRHSRPEGTVKVLDSDGKPYRAPLVCDTVSVAHSPALVYWRRSI